MINIPGGGLGLNDPSGFGVDEGTLRAIPASLSCKTAFTLATSSGLKLIKAAAGTAARTSGCLINDSLRSLPISPVTPAGASPAGVAIGPGSGIGIIGIPSIPEGGGGIII
jgi:hypothetical protein